MTFAEQVENEVIRAEREKHIDRPKWVELYVIIGRLAQCSILPDQAKKDKEDAFALIDELTSADNNIQTGETV
jgi:hypothetical protein